MGTLETKDHRTVPRYSSVLTELRERSKMDALRKCRILLQEAQLQENPWQGSLNLVVDDLFGTGGKEMEQRVLTRLRKDFMLAQRTGMM